MGGPPGDVPGRPQERVRRRHRAGRHQPLGERGLGQRVRRARVCCCRSTTRSPQAVKDTYFKGLWEEQLVDGVNYQFPWYQGLNVELINKAIFDKAGVSVDDFPKTIDGLPALCETIKDKTGTLCDIRLTVNDLLAQMVYEGNVKVISDDGKKFTFDSPEAVAWLQMYVDMVKAGTRRQHHPDHRR